MLEFVKQKMLNKRWMMLGLLIGNIFLVAVAACGPMYINAAGQKVLKTAMTDYLINNNAYPGEIRISADVSAGGDTTSAERFREAEKKKDSIKNEMPIRLVQEVTHYYIAKNNCSTQSTYDGKAAKKSLTVGMLKEIKKHARIVTGEWYQDEADENGIVDAVISQNGLVTQKLLVGEVLVFDKLKDTEGKPLKVRISGVFENNKEDDLYWVNGPDTFTSEILISEKVFQKYYGDFEHTSYTTTGTWHLLFDYEQMEGTAMEEVMGLARSYKNFFAGNTAYNIQIPFLPILEDVVTDSDRVSETLFVLQVPVMVLLIAFIFMVSSQIIELERNEIAIIKSRGAGREQILYIYLLQSIFIALCGIVAGIPMGAFLCQIFGSSNAFLEFVSRRALNLGFSWKMLLYALTASLTGIVSMAVPALKASGLTIVETKQKKIKNRKKVWWQRYYIDVMLLLVSAYSLYRFYGSKKELIQAVEKGDSPDPLLYLGSSIFVTGLGMLTLRLIPLVSTLIFRIGRKRWKPDSYTALLQAVRTKTRQYFIMLFLILTAAFGIFHAKTARTINTNAEKNVCYSDGADIVLMEQWDGMENDNTDEDTVSQEEAVPQEDTVSQEETVSQEDTDSAVISADNYTEPDFEKFREIQGVQSLAKVYRTEDAFITAGADETKTEKQMITLMGIHTKDFGETAWFSDGLLDRHWYHYLNAISQNTNAVLVSTNFKNVLGYKTGDVVTYTTPSGHDVRGVIYGFVDYWPGYNPIRKETNPDGTTSELDSFLIVAHLRKLQNVDGVLPYEVWMKVSGSTQGVYDYIEDKNIKLSFFKDAKSDVTDMKNTPLIQGTNGTLTVSFIVVLILCCAGFLIYWILSISQRALQFGIYRAMGMTMKEIFHMLIYEQLLITFPALAVGSLIGIAASKLYIPLIQIAYSSGSDILPMQVMPAGGDIAKMYIIVFVVIGICMGILGWVVSKIKVTQALKLGED